jgi:hypothetical protein
MLKNNIFENDLKVFGSKKTKGFKQDRLNHRDSQLYFNRIG